MPLQAGIWSEGAKVDTAEVLKKIDTDQAPEKISRVVSAIYALSDIELQTNGLNLSSGEDRLVRIFVKHFKAPSLARLTQWERANLVPPASAADVRSDRRPHPPAARRALREARVHRPPPR